jgi:phosphopantetheinyl transferase
MIGHAEDRLALPTSIDRIRFFAPTPSPGARVDAAVRVREVDPASVRAELELVRDGRVLARIDGWEDRRFDSDEVVWPLLVWPERNTLASAEPGGWFLAQERWRSSASRELMMRRYLDEAEREDYAGRNPRAQRLFLLGRIAAKDAVRRWLWDHGAGPLWPIEVTVANDGVGRPVVRAPGGHDLRISIAHSPWVGVAVVGEGIDVGIDVERVEERSEHFVSTAFSVDELALLTAQGPAEGRSAWVTRGWAAKEAVAKAGGTGLQGRPRDFVVTACRGTSLVVNGQRVDTARHGDAVVAWTVGVDEETEAS